MDKLRINGKLSPRNLHHHPRRRCHHHQEKLRIYR